ncbi:MAG TPA: ethanolamine ammonia-lyase subunit EutC [Candidatus Acidoferrales bacterium]|nr:ethanolamine ammonia-lyase subunit EutC [Candidatus Acidoferrales bacterium]
MSRQADSFLAADFTGVLRKIGERTPARIFSGRAGAAYRTSTQLELREAHAAARDAVREELDLRAQFDEAFIKTWNLFEVRTEARSKEEYLLQPDKGRRFSESSRQELVSHGSRHSDIQIAIGDGLSVTAIAAQVPTLLPLLHKGAQSRGWTVGNPFVIRYCRVGVLNAIGELLAPTVAVLLIGERPGLATAESLSAYMAYQPRAAHTDANRNLVSNIHSRGLSPHKAADRILSLAAQIMAERISGFSIRDQLPPKDGGPALKKSQRPEI